MHAEIDKSLTFKKIPLTLKLSFTLTDIPQEEVTGEVVNRDDLIQIGAFIPEFFEEMMLERM